MQLNPHYAELNESYLFSTIAHKVADYQKAHPEADVIRLGIGDVTLPLAASVTEAMHKAVEEQGPQGRPSTATSPASRAMRSCARPSGSTTPRAVYRWIWPRSSSLTAPRATWATCWALFSQDNTILVPDPVYPVYVDDNVMAGRKILYLPATAGNNFLPMPDEAPPRRYRLHLQPQQPHRCHLLGGAAESLGGLGQAERCRHPV